MEPAFALARPISPILCQNLAHFHMQRYFTPRLHQIIPGMAAGEGLNLGGLAFPLIFLVAPGCFTWHFATFQNRFARRIWNSATQNGDAHIRLRFYDILGESATGSSCIRYYSNAHKYSATPYCFYPCFTKWSALIVPLSCLEGAGPNALAAFWEERFPGGVTFGRS